MTFTLPALTDLCSINLNHLNITLIITVTTTYSTDGTNVYGSRGEEFGGTEGWVGVESYYGVFPIHLFTDTFAVGCIV